MIQFSDKCSVQKGWIGRVTFKFENTRDALVKLTSLPVVVVSKVRHVYLIESTPYAFDLDEHLDATLPLSILIANISGLRLETLTVFKDTMTESLGFFADYIKYGCGWRELRCVICSTYCLEPVYRSEGETIDYDAIRVIANECDTSIAIFRARDASVRGSIMHPTTRQLLDPDTLRSYSYELLSREADSICLESLFNREVLLVAKRGSTVDITASPCGEAPPYTSPNSRTIKFSDYKGTRALGDMLAMYQVDRYIHPEAAAIEAPIEIDTYRDIDDFIWPQNDYDRLLPEEYVIESLRKLLDEGGRSGAKD